MYSCGMGGTLRCLAIASHLAERIPGSSFLALTDLPILGRFALPPNFDYVHMPALSNGAARVGGSTPRLSSGKVAARLRSTIAGTTIEAFGPDLVLVDRDPAGLEGELLQSLAALRGQRPETRLVIGLPDVLGEPDSVRAAWGSGGARSALELYDEAWVYGSADIFDTARVYGLPDELDVHYTGYFRYDVDALAARAKLIRKGLSLDVPMVLVCAGGGSGGFPLLDTYLDFLEKYTGDLEFQSHLVCGPLMPARERELLEERARKLHLAQLDSFHTSLLPYLHAASLVVSNFGFNTSCEILSLGKRAVVVPNARAMVEQLLRARRMEERGLIELLEPDELDRDRLGTLVSVALREEARPPRSGVPLDGLEEIGRRVAAQGLP